tara:strand:+ start:20 stop:7027 length:7008 start_codon:yes stop_codon:yes gene_type:complete
MASNFNVTPYYDDYDVNSGYLKILFKPGNSVQARELTQIQSILQQQIANISDHFFKEGSMIIPGQSAVDTDVTYLKIQGGTYNGAPTNFVGRVVVGSITGIRALVVHAENSTGSTSSDDPDTLYVKFISGADISDYSSVDFVEGDSISFAPQETLTTESVTSESDYACEIMPSSETPVGKGSISFIESGIYYVQKHLVLVNSQRIVLDKYSNTPSYKIGLQINESFVNSNLDNSLLDNAQGTTNFNSPGADRYSISLIFSKRSIDEIDTSNFVELISIRNGSIESHVRTTNYSVLEETLARRTYDESGDYTIRSHKIDIRELLNENSNRGVSTIADFEFSNEVDAKLMARTRFGDDPDMVDLATGNGLAHTVTPNDISNYSEQNLDSTGTKFYPGKTHDSLVNALRSRLALGVEPGKSYVRGYELENLVTQFVDYKKSRENIQKNNEYLTTRLGNFIYLTDVMGIPVSNEPVNLLNINVKGNDHIIITDNPRINSTGVSEGINLETSGVAYKTLTGGAFDSSNNVVGADIIGTAKVKYVEHFSNPQNYDWRYSTFAPDIDFGGDDLYSDNSAIYKVYLYDIKMEINPRTNREYSVTDMRSIESQSVSGSFSIYNGNVLVEYTLVDQLKSFGSKSLIYSEYQDDKVRGIIYHNDFNKILVKALGGGNPDTVSGDNLNPRLFENNEVVREVVFQPDGTFPSDRQFSGSINHDIGSISNSARIISKNIIFDTSGSSIVDTGSDFVKTIRFVDDDSGNTSVDTSYTVQMKFDSATISDPDFPTGTGTNSMAVLQLGANSNQVFANMPDSGNSKYYFAFTPSTGTGTSAIYDLTSSNVVLSPDSNNRMTTATIKFSSVGIGSQITIFAPVIKTNAIEKQKEVKTRIDYPYTGYSTTGNWVSTGAPADPEYSQILSGSSTWVATYDLNDPSARAVWVTGDLYGVNQNSDGTFNQSTTDGLGNSLSLSKVQLDKSDICELIAVYDTCTVDNVVFRSDNTGTKKYYAHMTESELKYAADSYNNYENDIPVYRSSGLVFSYDETANSNTGNAFSVNETITTPSGASATVYGVTLQNDPDDIPNPANYTQTVTFSDWNNIAFNVGDVVTGQSSTVNQAIINVPSTFSEPPAPLKDITDRYVLDNGQRTGVYDLGEIKVKPNYSECAGRIIVVYKYFDHGTGGDYFSVDSYTHSNSGTTYSEIPSFKNNRLSDVLDFRPQKVSVFPSTDTNTPIKGSQISTSSNTPLDNSYVIADYRHYLPRKDKVYLSKDGDFEIKYGAAAVKTDYPEDPSDGMVIYKLETEPYTMDEKSVTAEMLDNKRYTMRDIGKLEKRIKTIEYYTSLSLLEKETKDMEVLDDNGLDRFKNGFVVEPFTGHNIGDVFDVEYKCSIDIENNELRPTFNEKNVPMNFNQTESLSYDIKDGLVMLPYQSVILSGQSKSSKTESVNPYAVMGFRGSIKLFPQQDEWRDTKNLPDLTSDVSGQMDHLKFSSSGGKLFNETQIVSTGSSQKKNNSQAVSSVSNSQTLQTNGVQSKSSISSGFSGLNSTESTGDKEIQSNVVPFIRERNIFFHASGMKPKTKVYAFFDGTPVSQYCSSLKVIRVKDASNTDTFVRTYESEIIDNSGDVTLVNNLGHRVRVVGIQYRDASTINFFVIDNIDENSFTQNQVLFLVGPKFTNGISPGKFDIETGSNSSSLITDESGNLRGLFVIPNTDEIRFRTGDRVFRLSDQQSSSGIAGTEAEGLYSAKGNLNTASRTEISTRPINYSLGYISSNRSVRTQVGEGSDQFNPIAQTFSTDKSGGVFITSVDLYFSAKDNVIPVTVELRNTVGGYPSKNVLARKTLPTSRISISDDGSASTNFLFDSPVFISQSIEYALVVLADSTEYRIHIARMGETAKDNSGNISKQPYAGVLFKSASTAWAPEPMEDMKFNLYRARFDTTTSSTLYFENSDNDKLGYKSNTIELDKNSIEVFVGQNIVRFHVPNHDLVPSTNQNTHYFVTISGLNPAARYGGILDSNAWLGSELNGTHQVIATKLDTFDILLTNTKYDMNGDPVAGTSKANSLTSSGRFNPAPDSSGKVTIQTNSKFDMMMPVVETIQLPQTNISYSMKTTSGISQDSDMQTGIKDSSWTSFVPNENIVFDTPRSVYSSYNELNFGTGSSNFEKKSLTYKVILSSVQDNLSPVIDTQRFSSVLTSNALNYPSWSTTTDSSGNSTDVSTNYASFISEREESGGSVESKYVTREIQLNQPATAFKIVLAMHRPQDADVDLYYKIKTSDSQEYRKLKYDYIDRPSGYSESSTSINQFTEFEYDVKDLSEFSSFGIKIVMRSKNSALPPRLKDLRIIALAN